jgi:hypothetical protein
MSPVRDWRYPDALIMSEIQGSLRIYWRQVSMADGHLYLFIDEEIFSEWLPPQTEQRS